MLGGVKGSRLSSLEGTEKGVGTSPMGRVGLEEVLKKEGYFRNQGGRLKKNIGTRKRSGTEERSSTKMPRSFPVGHQEGLQRNTGSGGEGQNYNHEDRSFEESMAEA